MDTTSIIVATSIGELQSWPNSCSHADSAYFGPWCDWRADCTACTIGMGVGLWDPEVRDLVCPFCGAKERDLDTDAEGVWYRGIGRIYMSCGTELGFCIIEREDGHPCGPARLTGYVLGSERHQKQEDDAI